MIKSFHARAIVLASLMALSPAAGLAQNSGGTSSNSVANTANTDSMDTMGTGAAPATDAMANDMALAQTAQPEREDHDFPWGLLGLLGLAGLFGRKRHDDDHVRVDRTTGGTTTRP